MSSRAIRRRPVTRLTPLITPSLRWFRSSTSQPATPHSQRLCNQLVLAMFGSEMPLHSPHPTAAFHKSRATATTCLRWVSLIPNITPTRSIHRDFWVIPICTALCYSTVQLVSYRNAEQNKWFVRSEPTQIQNVVVLVWWIPAHHRDVCCGSKC